MTSTNATSTRVLVAARLSRITGQGKSRIDRDDEAAQRWAEAHGHTIVEYATDAGVSGSVSPWKRKGLGPWLTDPNLISQYDEIVASTIDRVGRSARDLHDLQTWAEDNNKTIRILSPSLVWPPDPDDLAGPIVWDVLGRVAEIELRMIKARTGAAQQTIKDNGALIGKPPFGFVVTGEKYSKTIAPDPQLVPYLQGMIDRALRGDSLRSICVWLDSEGVKPLHGQPWNGHSVSNLLRNQALIGKRVDANGKVLLRFQGVISPTEFRRLQAALDGRPARRGPRIPDMARLTGVIECDQCGRLMYRQRITKTRKSGAKATNAYYRCGGTEHEPSRCKNMVPLDDIEDWVDLWFTQDGPFAHHEIIETTTVPGDDHAAEVAEIETEIRALDLDDDNYDTKLRTLRTERNRLKALPSEPAKVIERPTGVTVGEMWPTLDDEAKRGYLLSAGVKLRVMSNGSLRAQPGAEMRYLTGDDPYKVIGTLQRIVA